MAEDLRFPKYREIASRLRDEVLQDERAFLLSLPEDKLDLVVALVKRAYRSALRDAEPRDAIDL